MNLKHHEVNLCIHHDFCLCHYLTYELEVFIFFSKLERLVFPFVEATHRSEPCFNAGAFVLNPERPRRIGHGGTGARGNGQGDKNEWRNKDLWAKSTGRWWRLIPIKHIVTHGRGAPDNRTTVQTAAPQPGEVTEGTERGMPRGRRRRRRGRR